LKRLEGENIRKHDCVNKNIAGLTRKETSAKYHQKNKEQLLAQMAINYRDNKEQLLAQMAVYRATHKEQITTQKAVPYTCICGCVITTGAKSRHEKSKKHKSYMTLHPIIQVQEVDVNVVLQPLK
jgi:hypothetical protein